MNVLTFTVTPTSNVSHPATELPSVNNCVWGECSYSGKLSKLNMSDQKLKLYLTLFVQSTQV